METVLEEGCQGQGMILAAAWNKMCGPMLQISEKEKSRPPNP